MALTQLQIQQLNDASLRRTSGSATPEDIKNLDYATKTFGYKAPTPVASPMTQGVSSPTRTATQTLQAWDSNTGQQIWVKPGEYVPGASLTKPSIPTSVNVNQLGSNASVTPTVPPTPTPAAPFVSGLTAGTNIESILNMTSPELTKTKETQSSLSQKLLDQLSALTGRSARTQELTTQAGLPEMQKQLADLNVQIAQKAASFDKQMVDEQGKPILNAIIGGRTSFIQRQKAVELGGLSAVAQAMQGNISAAQNTIKETVQMEYQDQMDQIDALKTQLEVNRDAMTTAQKELADKQSILLDERKRLLDEQSNERKGVLDFATTIAQNGAPSSIASQVANARTIEEAIRIGGEYLKPQAETMTEYQKAQIAIEMQKMSQSGLDLSISEQLKLIEGGYTVDETGNIVKQVGVANPQDTSNAQQTLALIKDLDSISGGTPPTGLSGWNAFIPETKASNFQIKLNSLIGSETLKNMGLIKGVLSDADMKLLQSASTGGLSMKLSPKLFQEQLDKIKYAAQSVVNSSRMGINEVLDNGDGTYSYKNNDGTVHTGKMGDNYKDNTILQGGSDPLGLDFSNGGSGTPTATLKKASQAPIGKTGGQCGRFVNNLTGLGVGDSYQSKLAKMNPAIKTPKPGMVFVMPYKNTGHTGIILSVNPDGTATVKDSNWSLDEKVKVHQIPISNMTGFQIA